MSKPKIAGLKPIKLDMEPGEYFWCACGRSAKQPFCDGSHKGSEFSPVKVTIEEKTLVAWCACKHSQKGAFCDGTHRQVERGE
ncbi:MAG: CDGSH iron-sulfur domain-containing protein [Thermoanaerobaculaceae bacterium]